MALNCKSRGTDKVELCSQGTYDFQILGNETLAIADYKDATIFKFAMLDIKLRLKDDNMKPGIFYQF